MNQLIVMRHAKSDWNTGLHDHDRPLARRGQRAAPAMAEWLSDEDLCPTRVLTSSAARARQTADAVIETCSIGPEAVDVDPDLYLASASMWLRAASTVGDTHQPNSLLICGHNPGFDDLVDYLAEGNFELSGSGKLMTTAAIAVFEFASWAEITPQTASLTELKRPSDLDY